MKPILASQISKQDVKASINRIRVCNLCRRGFWLGQECSEHRKIPPKNLCIQEKIFIHIYYPYISFDKKKKTKKKKPINRKCQVCGNDSGGRMCCSDICDIRLGSCWIENGNRVYISLKEAKKRSDASIERKRLKDLSKMI